MTIEIRHRYSGEVIFTATGATTIAEAAPFIGHGSGFRSNPGRTWWIGFVPAIAVAIT